MLQVGAKLWLSSVLVLAGTLQEPVGLLGFRSLMISKQSFFDICQIINYYWQTSKHGVSSFLLPKHSLRIRNANLVFSATSLSSTIISSKIFCVPNTIDKTPATSSSTRGEETVPGESLLFLFKFLDHLFQSLLHSDQLSPKEMKQKSHTLLHSQAVRFRIPPRI